MFIPALYERLTIIRVDYYIPDFQHILNEFWWQFDDTPPNFPKAHKFLDYWHKHVKAVIKEVYLANAMTRNSNFINARNILKH